MKKRILFINTAICLAILFLLTACGPAFTAQNNVQSTVTINPAFQAQTSPVPKVPTYRCGAWSSNNAPGSFSAITIYARLTKDAQPVNGATATAVVHFQSGDAQLDQQPVSDAGGYVNFSLPLQGRQPRKTPVTVDVTFGNFSGGTVHCTPAFFTPQ
ncbi:MAG: hypothetical protein M3Z24_10950 [Chloroflexota bacterium]|nr:hypothetical protein [Chloroflexota bacterium]